MLAPTCMRHIIVQSGAKRKSFSQPVSQSVSQSGEVAETLSIRRNKALKYSGHLHCANVLFRIGE